MLREIFSWKGLKDDVLKYVNGFPTCQQNKVDRTHLDGLLYLLHIPEQKWESISMDFITSFPKVFCKDCIFLVVDRLTKFVVTTTFTAAQVAELFFKEFFILHGLPKRDSIFLSAFWK